MQVAGGTNKTPLVSESTRLRREDRLIDKWGKALLATTVLAWAVGFFTDFTYGLSIIAIGGFIAVFYGLKNPAIGLLAIGILCTIDAVARVFLSLGGLFRYNTLNFFLIAVAAANVFRLLQSRFIFVKILMVFVVLLIVQLMYSTDLDDGSQQVFAVSSFLGLVVLVARAPMRVKVWEWFGLIGGVVGALGAGLYFLQGTVKMNYNAFAYFPLTALFCTCLSFVAVGRRSRIRGYLLLLTVFNSAWVFLSSSRGSTLVAMCCLLFLTLQLRKVSYMVTVAIAILIVGSVISARFSASEEESLGRFEKLFDSESRDLGNRTSGRSDLFQGGWDMFRESPFLGIGTGSFSLRWADVSARENLGYKPGMAASAHSGWLKVLVENGIFGFALFLAFVFSFAVVGWNRRRSGVFPIGVLVTCVFTVALLTTEFQGKGLWLLAAAAPSILYRGFPFETKPSPRRVSSQNKPFAHTGSGGFRSVTTR